MMSQFQVLYNPSLREAGNKVINGLTKNNYVTLAGRCSVDYEGRSKTDYEGTEGDRHIIFKPDGNIQVHQDTGFRPQNWQTDAEIYAEISGNILNIEAKQTKTQGSDTIVETLDIDISSVFFVAVTDMKKEAEFTKRGTEEDVQDYILENPSAIQSALPADVEMIEKEYVVEGMNDNPDILGERVDTRTSIPIELKRQKADLDAIAQIRRYIEYMNESGENFFGILIAPGLTSGAQERIQEKDDIYFVEFGPRDIPEDFPD